MTEASLVQDSYCPSHGHNADVAVHEFERYPRLLFPSLDEINRNFETASETSCSYSTKELSSIKPPLKLLDSLEDVSVGRNEKGSYLW